MSFRFRSEPNLTYCPCPNFWYHLLLDFSDESGTGEVIAALLAWMGQQERQMFKRRIQGPGWRKRRRWGPAPALPSADPESPPNSSRASGVEA